MNESIELLDKKGNFTGIRCLKSKAHKEGLFHASVHLWLYDEKGQILIQKRAKTKDTHPNLWDVSVAGHIRFGERPMEALIRECKEEIGLSIRISDVTFIGTHSEKIIHKEDLTDWELHYIYTGALKTPFNKLVVQKSEVASIKLIDLEILKKATLIERDKKYVPHQISYYKKIIQTVEKYLS